MRTIKFRAKVKMPEKRNFARQEYVPEGQWVYGEPHTIDCPTPHIHTVDVGKQPIDKETIGQFTGLHDKNGKEIYEGDIVQCVRFIYRVQYDADRIASFYISRDGDFYNHYFGEAMLAEECEVIGNIYDTKTEDKK